MSEIVNFKTGQLLFKEGDEGGDLYVIRRGRVLVFRERNQTEVPLAELGPGEVLGTMTLLNGEPRTASVRALEPVEAVVMDASSFASGLKELPKWAIAVVKDLTARVKNVNEMLVQASLQDKRLRYELSNVFHHLGQLSHLVAFIMRQHTTTDDDGEFTPFRDVIAQAEPVLNLRYEYLAQLWGVITATGIVKEEESRKYGMVVRNPRPRLFEALGDYAYQVARKGIDAEENSRKLTDPDAERRRVLFERICRSVLEAEIKASLANKAHR